MADDTRQEAAPESANSSVPSLSSNPNTSTQPGSEETVTASDPTTTGGRRRPRHDFPKSQASKMWEAFGNPSEPINSMPGGMVNTAGGKPREVTWRDAFSAFSHKSDNPNAPAFYQTGCARDALLVGIGTGGGAGGLHFIIRGLSSILITTNIAVGAFAVTAAGMYTWCTQRQREEAKGIAAAVAGMKILHEKRAQERKVAEDAAAALEARRKAVEEEKERNKRWYKFW